MCHYKVTHPHFSDDEFGKYPHLIFSQVSYTGQSANENNLNDIHGTHTATKCDMYSHKLCCHQSYKNFLSQSTASVIPDHDR